MRNTTRFALAAIITLCGFTSAFAQLKDAKLNDIKIGSCPAVAGEVDSWIDTEQSRGLVIDSRPFAINQSTGKILFTRGAGRVTVKDMDPFVYEYRISVAQQELVSTAVSDFLKLILPT